MAAILEDGKLRLSGYVGDYYFEDGFTSSDVVLALGQIGDADPLTVHLNSGGGVATEGAAIHALLSARSGTTDIVVEGIAASAASLIAMAGDTVTMSAGSVMMIHDPSGMTWGTSADHAKTVEGLEALATAYARVYAQKSGKSAEACRAIMKEERWLTPEQAVAEGFADDTTETKADPVAAFDYRAYAHAPKRLTALAAKKNWRLNDAGRAATAASTRQPKETSMSDDKNGVDAGELARLREENATMKKEKGDGERRDAVMALPEAEGREEHAKRLAEAGMTADAAKGVLAGIPKAEAAAPPSGASVDDWEARRAAGAGMQGGKPTAAASREKAKASWGPIVEANNKRHAR